MERKIENKSESLAIFLTEVISKIVMFLVLLWFNILTTLHSVVDH